DMPANRGKQFAALVIDYIARASGCPGKVRTQIMQIEKFSVKALTISMLLIVGIVAIVMAFVSEIEYRDAAVQAQTKTVSRILGVASDAALSQLVSESGQLSAAAAKALSRQPELGAYLAEAPAGTRNPVLEKLLAAPLRSNLPSLKPVSVRLFNSNKQQLMLAGETETGENNALESANKRQTSAAFWLSDKGARYSVVRPVGDKTGRGYLEISFDPIFTLQRVADLTGLPLRIQSAPGDTRFESEGWETATGNKHEIQHWVMGSQNIPVAQLFALDDFSSLYEATRQTRDTTTAAFVALLGVVLLIAIMLLNRFLFEPVKTMIHDMEQVAKGETNARLGSRALKEFHTLANAFNTMTQQVQDTIERERQASEDVKGKVELIQDVVAMAAEGNLTGQIMVYRDQDIISELAAGIQQMLESLNSLVFRIQQSGVQVTSSATEIAATAKQQEATVTEQAATTNEIKATVTEITATSKELLNTMNEVTEVAWKTSEGANAGRSSLHSMEKTMHQMMEATDSIGSKLAVLSEKAGNINTVVTTINRVADQTNLLS
ncbi:MAG TPA: methyl-accepting chemotaxis protein, partial [Gammaproteobacteria bacterium]|nr:methyl-accepting chemotaxis protein [Gammaproteobacteria bacterium]